MSKLLSIKITSMAIAAAVGFSSTAVLAEYPERPMTLLIGYKAGGGTDTVGRILSKTMGRVLGKQVNVVNKPGAGGGIASMALKKAKNDGYTMLMVPSETISLAPLTNTKLTYKVADFDYAGTLTQYQTGIVAPIDAPYNNLAEFIAHAKKNPGLKYANLNAASDITVKYLQKAAGIELTRVPVKGGAGMTNAIIGKQVDVGYSGGIHQRYPDRIKLIAPLTELRHNADPSKATVAEAGYPLAFGSLTTLILPKGTPKDIIAKLENAMKVASTDPDVLKITEKVQFPIVYKTAAEATAEMDRQNDAYIQLIKDTGYKAK